MLRKFELFLLLACSVLFGATNLVRVELDNDRLGPLFDNDLKVLKELDNSALVYVDDTEIPDLATLHYEVLSKNPVEGDYYVVYMFKENIDLKQYGEILTSDNNAYVIRLFNGALENLTKEPVELCRLMFRPIIKGAAVAPSFFVDPIVQDIVNQVNADSILSFVRRLQMFRSRYSTYDSCFAAANWIASKFIAYGCDTVYLQNFQSGYAPNVIGVKRGIVYPDSIYAVIDGHLDATSGSAPAIAPGADDNASGTIAAVEAARVMKDYLFEYSAYYIAFCGEEQGLVGSDYYAQQARTQHDSILGVLNGDMIAYSDILPESVEVLHNSTNLGFASWFIAVADTYTNLICDIHETSSIPSDIQPFYDQGYPGICTIEDYMPTNPHYHQTSDTIGAGYNNNAFCTEVTKAEIAALALLIKPSAAVYLKTLDYSINDPAPGGNNDGMWQSGETVYLTVPINNIGIDTADNAIATITTADTYVTIIDGNVDLGDILPRDTVDAVFQVSASSSTPQGHLVNFNLHMTCTQGAWDNPLDVWINPLPTLTYQHNIVLGGNGNGILDPGETADLVVTIKNEGAANALGVTSVLMESSPYITINDASGNFGSIGVGDTASNNADPYNVTASGSTPTGTMINFSIQVTSGTYVDTLSFGLVVGRKHYYVWNPDPTPLPGQNMHTILTSIGYSGDYGITLASDLTLYKAVLVCAGIYSNNYIIASGSAEATALVDFLQNQDGRVYLEGGDVWYYDPLYQGGYNFGPLFGISASSDGSSDLGPIQGQTGTFTVGMSFNYGGENNWIDHIDPTGTGFLIFHDTDNTYNCGVANAPTGYRTVGTSFELGLLTDGSGVSTRAALLDSIMRFFGCIITGIKDNEGLADASSVFSLRVYPSIFHNQLIMKYSLGQSATQHGGAKSGALKIYDASGRVVKSFTLSPRSATQHGGSALSIIWYGIDDAGRLVPAGVYFVKLETADKQTVQKVVLLR